MSVFPSSDKPSRVLLAIDLQRGFITSSSRHIIEPIRTLQRHFDHVIFTRFHNSESSPFRRLLDYHKMAEGEPDTELVLSPRAPDSVIDRSLYTCATSKLQALLKRLGVHELYVCGIATEACVLKTVLDLFERNIRCWIIEDLCASDEDAYYHGMGLALLAKLIGKKHIIYSDEIEGAPV